MLITLLFLLCTSTVHGQQPWYLLGNTIGPNHTNFVGTLNSYPLDFRVFNQWSGTIDTCGRTFIGYKAGNRNANCSNTGFGAGVLSNVSPLAGSNTGVGKMALHLNQTGSGNVAVGEYSLRSNTTASYNTGLGWGTLSSNTTGSENTAGGAWSLNSNTTGSGNTGYGKHSLNLNTTGNYNTAVGWNTLSHNTSGSENTAYGAWSLYSNTTGLGNAAFGQFSLNNNTTGTRNTALGWNTLSHNLTGYDNCSAGSFSLYYNTSGYRNVSLGNYSMASNTTGWANTSTGYQAAYSTTKGHGVVALGYRALCANTLGNDNTALGNQAFLNGAQYNNSSAIGYLAQPQASNQIVLGNGSITSLRCHTTSITTGSDKRIKDDVRENVPGLEFIQQLRPVTYHLNVDKLNTILGVNDSSEADSKYDVQEKQMSGFIAQEVEAAAKACKYDFSGVDKPEQEGGLYGLRYAEFVVPLVKATQELNTLATEQAQVITAQMHTIEDLQKRLERMEVMLLGATEKTSNSVVQLGGTTNDVSNSLHTNTPNPFDGTTTVRYHLAPYSTDAFIRVVTLEGAEVAAYHLEKAGDGQIVISSESLSNGIYFYELMVDGERVASHKMLVQK